MSASFQLSPPVHRQLFVNPNVQQSSELLKGQLTLLPGRLLEQLYTEQPTQGKPHLTTLTSQFTPGTVLHSLQRLACSSVSSPLVLCIASLCGKTTSVCPSLRHSRLLLISAPQHLNRQTTPQPALSPLAISLPATNCLRLLHLSIRTLGRWNTSIFSSVHSMHYGHLKSCMLMLLNSPMQMLQPELQTWLCGFGSLPLMVSQDFSSSHSLGIIEAQHVHM